MEILLIQMIPFIVIFGVICLVVIRIRQHTKKKKYQNTSNNSNLRKIIYIILNYLSSLYSGFGKQPWSAYRMQPAYANEQQAT